MYKLSQFYPWPPWSSFKTLPLRACIGPNPHPSLKMWSLNHSYQKHLERLSKAIPLKLTLELDSLMMKSRNLHFKHSPQVILMAR